ncbi:hypothetical protein KIPB_006579, partial [Kipferlia bialata]|eukprot:g6579.t1
MSDASSEVEEGVYGNPVLFEGVNGFVAAPNAYEELKLRFDELEEAQQRAAKGESGTLRFMALAVLSGVLVCAVIALGVVALLGRAEIEALEERLQAEIASITHTDISAVTADLLSLTERMTALDHVSTGTVQALDTRLSLVDDATTGTVQALDT